MSMRFISVKRVSRSSGGSFLSLFVLLVLAAFMALPLVLVISNAFKPIGEIYHYPPRFFVRQPTLKNFEQLFSIMSSTWVPFSRYIFNSLFITAAGTAGHVLFASLCAYSLAKHEFRGKKLMNGMVYLSLMFSPVIVSVTSYVLMTRLGFVNTYWAAILPAFQSSIGLYLLRQFMDQMVPDALLEAARIDGATEFTLYARIVMPIVKPAWLTLIILSVQSLWNTPSTYLYSETLKTLPITIRQLMSAGIARAGSGAAVTLLLLTVPIATFVITQNQIIETMGTSGLKD